MEKVKERMRQLKDAIEEAQQRETDAKNKIKELDDKFDKLGGEKTTLQSRINVVQTEYEKIVERLEESQEKLDAAIARTEESEVRRKHLAETEVDEFERSEEIEATLKAAAVKKENADHLVVEAERKVIVLERDLARTEEKYERFNSRVEELVELVDSHTGDIRALEQKDRDASEREDEKEDTIKFLETQLRESLSKAETHERDVGKHERLLDNIKNEMQTWKEKREEIRHEMEEAMGGLLED